MCELRVSLNSWSGSTQCHFYTSLSTWGRGLCLPYIRVFLWCTPDHQPMQETTCCWGCNNKGVKTYHLANEFKSHVHHLKALLWAIPASGMGVIGTNRTSPTPHPKPPGLRCVLRALQPPFTPKDDSTWCAARYWLVGPKPRDRKVRLLGILTPLTHPSDQGRLQGIDSICSLGRIIAHCTTRGLFSLTIRNIFHFSLGLASFRFLQTTCPTAWGSRCACHCSCMSWC